LCDSLANLSKLFVATVGEDAVKLFKYHFTCDSKARKIRVSTNIDFEWSHSNLNLK